MSNNTALVLCVASVCGLLAVVCWVTGSMAPLMVVVVIVALVLL